MKKVLAVCLISVCSSGCMAIPQNPFNDDHVLLYGSSEGIRAFYDGNNGIITNTKTTDPLGNSAHWAHRAEQEKEITKREMPKGFWQKLTTPQGS